MASTCLSFLDRAELPSVSPLNRYLFSLISIKRSNLCVSADVHTTKELLQVAEEVGDHICVLKTHADIIDDFSDRTIRGLQEVSKRKHFLLFEDRKFGDIGKLNCSRLSLKPDTLQSQYTRGPLHIATWANLTNAHLLPGPSIIPALHTAATETLVTLNQSVATTISAGTPRHSLDSNPDPEAPSSPQNLVQTSTNPRRTGKKPGTSSKSKEEGNVMFEHRRSSADPLHGAFATTTISQTYESAAPSPGHPPALLKTLSDASATDDVADTASALEELGPPPHARGLLLLAQMSSAGNLATKEYTNACVDGARANKEFVVGYICQENLNTQRDDGALLNFTPGVGMPKAGGESGDGKGQIWRTPDVVVRQQSVDVVIVGRGILGAEDRGREAERYRRAAWKAYEERIKG